MKNSKDTSQERFWKKVTKALENECWLWTGCKQGSNGYGYFRISKDAGNQVAHRFSYELHKGQIPMGMIVCHTCDNPICVNPNHLFVGTHQDNAIDRESKKRSDYSKITKLTEKQAQEIKSSNLSQSSLSKLYKVSRRTIASIQCGETWKHVRTHIQVTSSTEYVCVVCNNSCTKTIYKDNGYKYRKIRDDVCLRCNKALALLNNDLQNLIRAKTYLETNLV
jgi:hypothetical protein